MEQFGVGLEKDQAKRNECGFCQPAGVLGQSDEEITELIRQASRQPTVPTASQS